MNARDGCGEGKELRENHFVFLIEIFSIHGLTSDS